LTPSVNVSSGGWQGSAPAVFIPNPDASHLSPLAHMSSMPSRDHNLWVVLWLLPSLIALWLLLAGLLIAAEIVRRRRKAARASS
jgi:hypothetical protein